MLFNSIEYLIFLPIVFILYWSLNRNLRLQNGLILLASYFFYGWWSKEFLALLILSTLLDYLYGFGVASSSKKKSKLFLWLSIINNLGILGVFKYYNFFIEQVASGLSLAGIRFHPMLLEFALPVGISFYTFHGMSYVFDIYRGHQKPVRNYIDYAVFVAFFPLLVAGPIERANHLLPQVQKSRFFNYTQSIQGLRLILWGFFKKVVIADTLSGFVDAQYLHYHEMDSVSVLLAAIAFSFQIYGDFSGYSDIALGTAKLLGFELLSNFKFPYFSRDVAEFWRRWHVSLSSWFRDYLYIPLGGSKNGKLQATRNTFIIFLVSGFWHGASWNFIAWGFIHALGFIPLLLLNKNRKHSLIVAEERKLPTLGELVSMLLTFCFVTIAWVFFRAQTLSEAVGILDKIGVHYDFTGAAENFRNKCYIFAYIVPLLIGDWFHRRNERDLFVPQNRLLRWFIYLTLGNLFIYYLSQNQSASFIYFQF